MRLLEIAADASLRLVNFPDETRLPQYAILSHTWGEDEFTFQEMQYTDQSYIQHKPGYRKIAAFCRTVSTEHEGFLRHVWVYTCCIDKTSSAELSEAINSMFRFNSKASYCYVHFEDVSCEYNDASMSTFETEFRSSRWFQRGWTS
jgi:hypothetical protein